MTLLAIIAALLGERFLGSVQDYRQFRWLPEVGSWLKRQSASLDGWAGAVLILAVAGIGVHLIYLWLLKGFFLLGFAASAVVLLVCLGPQTFYDQVKSFCEAMNIGNQESALWYLDNVKDSPLTEAENSQPAGTMLEAALVALNNRLLGVIFWFVLLGPLGAVIYRISGDFHRSEEEERSSLSLAFDRIHYLLNWPTARLVSISYGAMGNFVESVSHLKQNVPPSENWPDPNEQLIVCSGLGAMNLSEERKGEISCREVSSGLALLRRSVAFWVGVIALLTLVGWLG